MFPNLNMYLPIKVVAWGSRRMSPKIKMKFKYIIGFFHKLRYILPVDSCTIFPPFRFFLDYFMTSVFTADVCRLSATP